MRPKPKPAISPQWNQRLKIIEEFALIDREVRNFKPRLLRHEKLRNLILEWHADLPPKKIAQSKEKLAISYFQAGTGLDR